MAAEVQLADSSPGRTGYTRMTNEDGGVNGEGDAHVPESSLPVEAMGDNEERNNTVPEESEVEKVTSSQKTVESSQAHTLPVQQEENILESSEVTSGEKPEIPNECKEEEEKEIPKKEVNQDNSHDKTETQPDNSSDPHENFHETTIKKAGPNNIEDGDDCPPAEVEGLKVLPLLTPRRAVIGAIPSNDVSYVPKDTVTGSRNRIPPKFMRMATISVINGSSRPVTRESSLFLPESPRLSRKGVSWGEATNSRPPLRVDLEGPTPCTYSPRNKPLGETNAPAYSFGAKCQPEKNGGGRTSWWKTWFQTPHVWLNKVDFLRDRTWPTPSLYENRSPIGTRQVSVPTAPAFTISTKESSAVKFPGVVESPSPNHYNRQSADGQTYKRSSSFTHGWRRGGTIPWPSTELTPGPGQYNSPLACHTSCPAFTIQGLRREKSYRLGPFSTF